MSTERSNSSGRQSRAPVQARSQRRIEAALAAAEALLVELGADKISIPEIAARANVPRTAIYPYFPDKYALFAHLAEIQFGRVADAIAAAAGQAGEADWRELVRIMVDAVADFYDAHEVAAILLLTGPFGRADGAAHVEKDRMLADIFRARLGFDRDASRDAVGAPDRVGLAIQIAFACLRWGYVQDGALSSAIRAEAVRAVIAYIAPFVPGDPVDGPS